MGEEPWGLLPPAALRALPAQGKRLGPRLRAWGLPSPAQCVQGRGRADEVGRKAGKGQGTDTAVRRRTWWGQGPDSRARPVWVLALGTAREIIRTLTSQRLSKSLEILPETSQSCKLRHGIAQLPGPDPDFWTDVLRQ